MSQPSIKKNIIISGIYQLLTMAIPLITAPYISRVLGADGVGTYSFTYSIETYFLLFAALGTQSYGAREIARNREDKKEYSKLFWEIEGLSILTTVISTVAWFMFILISNEYKVIYLVLTFYLFANMMDISWFYTGLEQFKYTVIQNTIFKILGTASLFIFVNEKDDVVIYIFIMAFTTFLSNSSMWIYLPKLLTRIDIKRLHILVHFKQTLIYFVPTIAISIYTVLDKTLIALITKSNTENGYYEQATKIINMAKLLTFSAVNNVMTSRISYLYSSKKMDEIKLRIEQSFDFILFMGMGITVGIIGVADIFVPVFFGKGYEPVILLMRILSPVILIIGVSNCLETQYYTPVGLRKKSNTFVILGAFINLVLNILLINKFGSAGAIVATLVAELVISSLYLTYCNRIVTISLIWKKVWKKIIASAIMLLGIMLLKRIDCFNLLALFIQVIAGGCIYIFMLILLKDSFAYGYVYRLFKERIINRKGIN